MAGPPTGTLSFLSTDIEGSTTLWERYPQAMQRALSRHDEILRHVTEEHQGYVFKTVRDAFCCAFPTALDALEVALEIQRRLLSSEWEQTGSLLVRMALHTGATQERDGDYFGPPVNRVTRLLSAAHGSQVLLSLPAQELVRDQLPAGAALMDLGEKHLKDLFREQGDKQSLAFCLNNMAMMVYAQGDLGRAAQLTEECVALHRELGNKGGVSTGLYNLGWMALFQDDLGRAADLYRESLSLSWDAGMYPLVQMALEGFACVAGAEGETERAARLWGAAQALHETKGIPRDIDFLEEADARISAVRLGLGEQAWEEAQHRGRAMSLDEAVSYALEEADA